MDSVLNLILVPIITGVVILIVEYWVILPMKERDKSRTEQDNPSSVPSSFTRPRSPVAERSFGSPYQWMTIIGRITGVLVVVLGLYAIFTDNLATGAWAGFVGSVGAALYAYFRYRSQQNIMGCWATLVPLALALIGAALSIILFLALSARQ